MNVEAGNGAARRTDVSEEGVASDVSGHSGALAVAVNRCQAAKSSSGWGWGRAGAIGGARGGRPTPSR